MADETMFARLVTGLVAELQHQHEARVDTGLSYFKPPSHGADWCTIDGNVVLSAIVRALLAELRDTAEEARLKAAEERQTRTACDMADVREFIDAILAEAGGSGG